jgi:hypothetical protein
MKLRDQATNAENTRPSRFRSDVPEERGKNVPTPDEIRRRVLEIHIERGGHGYDLDEYLDEWLRRNASSRKNTTRALASNAKDEA